MTNLTQVELTEKEKLDEERGGVFVSFSAVLFTGLTVVIVIVATGLLVGFLPEKHCDEISPTALPTEPTTTKDPNTIWDSPRLPETLRPLHYNLKMTPDLENFTFDGQISVTFLCEKATDLLVLNSNNLEIQKETASINGFFGGRSGIASILRLTVDPTNQYLNVLFDDNLVENTQYEFSIGFRGVLNDNIKGFYRSSYKHPDGGTRWLAVTFFSPTNARMAFPCFDDPGLKANFTLTIVHAEEYTALGNMPAESAINGPDGLVTTQFATSPKISTYLVCFAVLDFPFIEMTSKNNITIRGWARPDAMDSLEFGLNMTAETLDFYIQHIGVGFPLPKIDVVAVPNFEANAMENWGLITYRETALLNKEDSTSESRRESQGFTIAHEMGHQYFGNLVTQEWWEYMILKEGGASYLGLTSLQVVQPTWEYDDLFVINEVTPAMASDAQINARPIQKEVSTPAEIAGGFGSSSYDKSPAVLRMCEHVIGKPTFKKGLTKYMTRYAFGTATNDDFWECLQEAVNEDGSLDINVNDFMHSWVLQSGFPVVNLTRNYEITDEISFTAEQSRFLLNQDETDDANTLWMIPLTFRTNLSPTNTEPVWLNGHSVVSPHVIAGSNDDWLLMNPDRFGFYRVNYDVTNWEILSGQLVANHSVFSVSSRASLIDDSFSLARAGNLGYSIPLGITRYLAKEMDYVPWSATSNVMKYLDKLLITSGAYGSFVKYMRSQITPLYNSLGWEDTGLHLRIMTRRIAISNACKYNLVDCQEKALALYRTWMANESVNAIPVNHKRTVYCTAISMGRGEEFSFALQHYLKTPDPNERSILLDSMPCTRQTWALSSLLSYTLDAEVIKAQDVPLILGDVARNPIGTLLAWDFFRANYDIFREKFGGSLFQFSKIIKAVTKPLHSEFHLRQLEKFMSEHPDQGTGASAFKQSVEEIKTNIRWMKSYYEEVREWLEDEVA
ncbi:aminopeptidase N-like [Asterias amurensis]|uniref:aminopeptidase N-like n=1 Tax=Asterias amurensis TaxID=7602 RepID=UPI003AB5374A